MSAAEVVALMDAEEAAVLDALRSAAAQLAVIAERVAATYQAGGRVFFLGAGTSGRIAVAEAAELPPTFGVPEDRFVPFIASGPSGGPSAITRSEDDVEAGCRALDDAKCSSRDVVIGLAASGSTPFVVEAVRHARSLGAWTCGISNNIDRPLLDVADFGVLLNTGPEILAGSTRMKAGTAQKMALNRITTAAMVRSGAVIENLMVEVRPVNAKLTERCIRIVSELTGRSPLDAEHLLDEAGGSIRAAVDGATMARAREEEL